jgi:hypothetical protein
MCMGRTHRRRANVLVTYGTKFIGNSSAPASVVALYMSERALGPASGQLEEGDG